MKQPLRGAMAYLLATAAFLIILITAGVFDPKPVGELKTTLPASTFTVSQPGQTIQWLDAPLPDGDFSVRGTAVLQNGNPDSGIGLALGSREGSFIVAVSPLGYVLVQQAGEVVLPWQPWPHVQPNNAPNEIWIDMRGEELTIWLNRELLWQGSHLLSMRKIGIFSEGFGGETAVLSEAEVAVYTIPTVEIFAP
ncbi:hypothetical protein [Candidatus Leptofilum sp.]|uniref:hypothetical protein n=1 Tax=Candidatus Leptofilum sp. TaxID=3241576 RepID=UPI003B5CA393